MAFLVPTDDVGQSAMHVTGVRLDEYDKYVTPITRKEDDNYCLAGSEISLYEAYTVNFWQTDETLTTFMQVHGR